MRTLLLLLLFSPLALAQMPESWTRPVEPFRVVGNIYYIGTEELGSWLIATEKGLILLDAPVESNKDLLLRNIRKLGFDPKNVRILLASHAHFDHVGALAAMKDVTGGEIYLSALDADLAKRGGRGDFAFGDKYAYRPVHADHIVRNHDVVRLGSTQMHALLTPGHTRGCTTWQTAVREDGRLLDVVFLCSVTAPGYQLVDNPKYPLILADYEASFAALRKLDPDVFLGNHAGFYDLTGKRGKQKEGAPNPFIQRGELARYLDGAWKNLQRQEQEERAAH
jgi:metallo-beta-lactamase class B